ncbi:hypothetical protein HP420_09000, partial [Staphylococcus xylosus]|nr:hypothetical protein [Staphylococcus xylosus]
TQLCVFLKAYFNNDEETESADVSKSFDSDIILSEENIFKINPMINMGEFSPYDFVED